MAGESTPVSGQPAAGLSMFRWVDEPGTWPFAEWFPHAIGLLAGGFCTWLFCSTPPKLVLSWIGMWALASRSTVVVFVAAGVVTWIFSRLLAARAAFDEALNIACAATWLPVLVVFYRYNSPWCAAVAVALAIAGTRAVLVRAAPEGFREADTVLPRAVAAAAALEAGGAAIATNNWRAAGFSLPAAAACFLWIAASTALWQRWREPRKRWKRLRIVPVSLLAVTFSAGGLAPYLEPGAGGGGAGGFFRVLFGPRYSRSAEGKQADGSPDAKAPLGWTGSQTVILGDYHPGVTLYPEVQPYTTLVAPLSASRHGLFGARRADSLSIPFSGVYSFFPRGWRPRKPDIVHGDPARMSFRTTDHTALTMEACQTFGTPIDVACCRAIGLAIASGEPDSGTVALELILQNTTLPGQPSQSLGIVDPRKPPPADQTITFPMPQTPPFSQFDQAIVRFHLERPRSDQSAKIAVRRFVLVR